MRNYKIGQVVLVQVGPAEDMVNFDKDFNGKYLPFKIIGKNISGYDYTILVESQTDGWLVQKKHTTVAHLAGKRIWHIHSYMIKGLYKKKFCLKCSKLIK